MRWEPLVCAVVLAVSGAAPAAGGASFQALGVPPGAPGYGYVVSGISADGSVVVGTLLFSDPARRQGFRWTKVGGFELLPYRTGYEDAEVTGISGDGSVIIGLDTFKPGRALRWIGGQPSPLLDAGESLRLYQPTALSRDGSIIVGQGFTADGVARAQYWTDVTGMRTIDTGPNQDDCSVTVVSGDGRVIAGWTNTVSDTSPPRVFRWSAESGVEIIPSLAAGSVEDPIAISADGRTIVGRSQGGVVQPFVWTGEEGMIALGNLPGADNGSATDVSGDGSLVIGVSAKTRYWDAAASTFIWDRAHGMRRLQDVLTDEWGIDLDGWTLRGGGSISDDGTVIVGHAINPSGVDEAYVVVIPEPHALHLLWMVTLLPGRRSRRPRSETGVCANAHDDRRAAIGCRRRT